jgi:putative transposase
LARLPRIVISDEPMHIMHRGNNRQDIFQREEDYLHFLDDKIIAETVRL